MKGVTVGAAAGYKLEVLRSPEPSTEATTVAGASPCRRDFREWIRTWTVYPLRLPEPLPTIAIPLLPGDPAVSLDLQAVFDRTYDAGPYRREIDYRTAPPDPPLSVEEKPGLGNSCRHGPEQGAVVRRRERGACPLTLECGDLSPLSCFFCVERRKRNPKR